MVLVFAATVDAAASVPGYGYWLDCMAKEYGLATGSIAALCDAGMSRQEVEEYLESLYPHPPVKPSTRDFVSLSAETGISPLKAVKAYEFATKYRRDPVWLAGLYNECGDWERIRAAYARYEEAKLRIYGARARGALGRTSTDASCELATVYGVPPETIQRLLQAGADEQTVMDILFFCEVYSEGGVSLEFELPSDALTTDWLDQLPDMGGLHQLWPVRQFPAELLPLKPLASAQPASARYRSSPAPAPGMPAFRLAPEPRSVEGQALLEREEESPDSTPPPSVTDPSSLHNTGRVSPFKAYFDGYSDRVDPSSGALVIAQTDFTLPGRNRFDFSLTRVYNNLRGWLEREIWRIDGQDLAIDYRYDDAGNRISMTYPNGTAASFAYDTANRLVSVPGFCTSLAYDVSDLLASVQYANGTVATYTSDARGRTSGIRANQASGAAFLDLWYEFTNSGDVARVSDASDGGSVTLDYGYSCANQLTWATVRTPDGAKTVEYAYDGAGNRIREKWAESGLTMLYAYSPGNYPDSRTGPEGQTSYVWGTYGQLRTRTLAGAATTYEYSSRRLLKQVKVGGTPRANYEYDALGRLIKVRQGDTTAITLYSGNDIVYQARTSQAGATKKTCYICVKGKHLAKTVQEGTNPPVTYFLHTDMVGSIRAITDSAGQVVARFEYEPFGLLTISSGPMAGGGHRFTGKPEDEAIELYYFGARYYDPEVGRFISRDLAKQGLNWYTYCANNPLSRVDSDGNSFSSWLAKLGEAVVQWWYSQNGWEIVWTTNGHGPDFAAFHTATQQLALVDAKAWLSGGTVSKLVWAAYGYVHSEVSHALHLAAAGRDDEAMQWFREALDLFDTSLAAQSNERVSELSTGQMYSLYLASHATYIAHWAVAGTNDVQWLGRALRFELQWLELEGDERVPDPEKDDIFISALVESEDRDAALRGYNLLHSGHSSLEGMRTLGTPGSLACALMLAEDEADEDVRASVRRSYEDFLAKVIRYDKDGPHWPFRQFDFIRFQHLRHKYIERDNPSIFQLIREARGF